VSPGYSDENPQELKTQEGIGLLAGLISLPVVTDCCQVKALEARRLELVSPAQADGRQKQRNVMRARTFDEKARLGSRESPCRVNPTRGCGMKQARKAPRGANRREREER